jgi:hypothetical protein
MVNRNKALEEEALKAIHEENHPEDKPVKPHKVSSEEQALKASILSEKERKRKMEEEEEEQLRMVLELSKKEAEESAMIKKLEDKVAQKEVIQPKEEQIPSS